MRFAHQALPMFLKLGLVVLVFGGIVVFTHAATNSASFLFEFSLIRILIDCVVCSVVFPAREPASQQTSHLPRPKDFWIEPSECISFFKRTLMPFFILSFAMVRLEPEFERSPTKVCSKYKSHKPRVPTKKAQKCGYIFRRPRSVTSFLDELWLILRAEGHA